MEFVKLSNIASINAGGTPSRSNNGYWNGDIPWLKISDIKGKYTNSCTEYISEDGLNNSSAKYFDENTILYTIFATVGETSILNFKSTTNQAIAGIKLNTDNYITEYLYYYLKSIKNIVKFDSKGVAQNNINLSYLKNLNIPVVTKEKQTDIINNLNKIEEMIEKNNSTLLNLDDIVKSQFIEMFGTCNEYTNITNCVDIMDHLRKPINSEERMKMQEGILYPYYGATGQVGYVNDYLSDFEGLCIAEDCGNYKAGEESAYIVKGKIWVNNHAHLLKCKDDYNLYFLKEFLFQADLSEYVNGATRQKLTQSKLREIKVLNPSLELQNKFADFVQQIDKSKLNKVVSHLM